MDWIIGAALTLVGVAIVWNGVSGWLNQPPPPAQLSCRTCRQLQRQLQWWRLWFGLATAGLVVAFAFAVRPM